MLNFQTGLATATPVTETNGRYALNADNLLSSTDTPGRKLRTTNTALLSATIDPGMPAFNHYLRKLREENQHARDEPSGTGQSRDYEPILTTSQRYLVFIS